jgi:hypothetical protein
LSLALGAERADLGVRHPAKRPPERPPFCSKLDLPLPLTGGLRFFTFRLGGGPAGGASWSGAPRSGEGLTRLEVVLGTALPAALFSMAAVSAFMPAWVPDGVADRLNFHGRGRPPPLTGIGPDLKR